MYSENHTKIINTLYGQNAKLPLGFEGLNTYIVLRMFISNYSSILRFWHILSSKLSYFVLIFACSIDYYLKKKSQSIQNMWAFLRDGFNWRLNMISCVFLKTKQRNCVQALKERIFLSLSLSFQFLYMKIQFNKISYEHRSRSLRHFMDCRFKSRRGHGCLSITFCCSVMFENFGIWFPIQKPHCVSIWLFLKTDATTLYWWFYLKNKKAVPLHAMEAYGRRGDIAPTHS
jgi:hypothetical protein